MMPKSLVKLNKIFVEKNDVSLLKDINIEIRSGDIVNIHGNNGVGKTTLLRIISGLCEPTSGEVILLDETELLDKIFILGHKNGIKHNLTIEENLLYSSENKNLSEITTIIDSHGLISRKDVLIKHLSHGQQKRVSLMRALVNNYKIWLLDEPYSGLDKIGQEMLNQILVEHAMNEGAVVITNHDEIKIDSVDIKNFRV